VFLKIFGNVCISKHFEGIRYKKSRNTGIELLKMRCIRMDGNTLMILGASVV
jgi:hypothetical protein